MPDEDVWQALGVPSQKIEVSKIADVPTLPVKAIKKVNMRPRGLRTVKLVPTWYQSLE